MSCRESIEKHSGVLYWVLRARTDTKKAKGFPQVDVILKLCMPVFECVSRRFPIDEKNEGQQHIDTFLLLLPNGEVQSSGLLATLFLGHNAVFAFCFRVVSAPLSPSFPVGHLALQSRRTRLSVLDTACKLLFSVCT